MKRAVDRDYLFDEVYWKLNYPKDKNISVNMNPERWECFEEFVDDATSRDLIYQDMDGDFWSLTDEWEELV